MRRHGGAPALVAVTLLLWGIAVAVPVEASAQRRELRQEFSSDTDPVRGEFGVNLVLAMPVGEFDDYVDLGGGVNGFGVIFVDDRQTFGIRLDVAYLVYGSNTVRVPLSPTVPFVDVEVTTQNGIGSLGLGPQILLGRGSLRPYMHASVGFSYFATTTSVEGTRDSEPFASTTNFDDMTFAVVGGGGLRVMLTETRRNPVALDFGVKYVRNGLTQYLREGGLVALPDGGVEIEAIESETNLTTFHLGVTIGVR
jgi:hypothetical protein